MRINYRVRPNKIIERKMMAEALQRLSRLEPLSNYQYVGFGSVFFSDFRLFHNQLCIQPMISIEKDVDDIERYTYNAPFDCVQVIGGESNDVLPELDWTGQRIVWLDYTSTPNSQVLIDIDYLARRLVSHSVLIVTVNADPEALTRKGTKFKSMRDELAKRVGEDRIAFVTEAARLVGWSLASTYRAILLSELQASLNGRNAAGDPAVLFRQIFNFTYSDGKKMLTFGGVFHTADDVPALNDCRLEELDFYRDGDAQYLIDAPNLTPRELLGLKSCLPGGDGGEDVPVEAGERQRLARIYRYYPLFSEMDL